MDNLLGFLFKAVSIEPAYEPDLCLAANRATPCSACYDICPHHAIVIGKRVEIDPIDCSGCGLCVQACPTGALEPKVSYSRGAPVKCSRVKGTAQTVHCLARLQPTDLLRLVGTRPDLALGRGDCANCPVGGAAVKAAIHATVDDALSLARLHGRAVEIEVLETDRLDASASSEPISRRELLRGGWRSLQHGTGELLAPLDPGDSEKGSNLPGEVARRYRVIAAARPEPAQVVPWVLPRVDSGCIMCPACTKACPTGAIERVFEDDGEGVLVLRPEACVGCEACLEVCPVGVITMDEEVTWGELAGGVSEAHRRDPAQSHPGSVAR